MYNGQAEVRESKWGSGDEESEAGTPAGLAPAGARDPELGRAGQSWAAA